MIDGYSTVASTFIAFHSVTLWNECFEKLPLVVRLIEFVTADDSTD